METKVKSGRLAAYRLLTTKTAASQWLLSVACDEFVDRGRRRLSKRGGEDGGEQQRLKHRGREEKKLGLKC